MKSFRFLLLLGIMAVCHCFVLAQYKFGGQVVEIIDGRTVVIESLNHKMTVVLQNIEVPEPEQELHQTVKDHLKNLLLGKYVEILAKQMANEKTVGQIFIGNVDASQQMLRDGAAWFSVSDKDKPNTSENENYRLVELQAKLEKRGVWSIPTLKPAWEFRAAKEEKLKADELRESPLAVITGNSNLKRPIFGQPRYNADIVQQQAAQSRSMWGDIGSYFADENVNAAGLASKYIPSVDIGYMATTLAGFKVPAGSKSPKMSYRVVYYHRGSALKGGEDAFLIGFLSESNAWKFVQSNNLSITTDGQVISLGKAYRLFRKESNLSRELLLYRIRRSTLARMADSKKVEFKVGSYSGSIENSSQELLGMLLEYTK